MLRKKNERNGWMKKYVVGIVLALMLCVPFTGAYALDLLYEDFEKITINSENKTPEDWIVDFRMLSDAWGTKELDDGNMVMSIDGTLNKRSGTNINQNKDYRYGMIYTKQLNPGTTSPLKISFDIKIDKLDDSAKFQLRFKTNSTVYAMLDFLDTGDIRVGSNSRQDGGEKFSMGKWYNIELEYVATSEKPFTVTITPHDTTESFISHSYRLDRLFTKKAGTASEDNTLTNAVSTYGINRIDFLISGVGLSDDLNPGGTLCYDNIRIEKAPVANTATISGNTVAGKTLTASYTADATYSDGMNEKEKIVWYAENGDEDIALGEGSEYVLKRGDVGKQIYVQISPVDRSGFWGTAITSATTATIIDEGITLNKGENEVSATVTLIGDEETELSPSLFLALYDSTGKLYKIISDKTAEENVLSCTISEAVPTNGSARAFLWDKNLSAICWTE